MTAPAATPELSWAPSRAARELGVKRAEFDLAVHLGRVRTVPDEGGGGRRVPHAELERLRAEPDFPRGLLNGIHTVGTAEGAEILHVSGARFTRLARLGFLVPVRFYVNRYRAVVWLYLAEELRQFAAESASRPLLEGRLAEQMRKQLAEGLDQRPKNWRGRHLGFLLRKAEDPWERAGALASLLDPAQVAELVPDPFERAYVNRFRPGPPVPGAPGSPSAQLAGRLMTADDPDEIAWLRADLNQALAEARTDRKAPRPGSGWADPWRTPFRQPPITLAAEALPELRTPPDQRPTLRPMPSSPVSVAAAEPWPTSTPAVAAEPRPTPTPVVAAEPRPAPTPSAAPLLTPPQSPTSTTPPASTSMPTPTPPLTSTPTSPPPSTPTPTTQPPEPEPTPRRPRNTLLAWLRRGGRSGD